MAGASSYSSETLGGSLSFEASIVAAWNFAKLIKKGDNNDLIHSLNENAGSEKLSFYLLAFIYIFQQT